MDEVIEILAALDVNSCRLHCEFDPAQVGVTARRASGRSGFSAAAFSSSASRVLTKQPVPPASRVEFSESLQLGPAMSRWTQGLPSDELLQELRRRDGPSPLPADVLQVGHAALELLLVVVIQRQSPGSLARLATGREQALRRIRRRWRRGPRPWGPGRPCTRR